MRVRLIFFTLFCFITMTPAWSWISYNQNQSPSYLQNQANPYKQNNPYDNNNTNNPYSTYQSAYDPNSVRNNQAYGVQINSYNGQYQGTITQSLQHSNSVTNPYGQHGNAYVPGNPNPPYVTEHANNPYSSYQDPYNDGGVRNNSQYGIQYENGYGDTIGANHIPGNYNTNTVSGSYAQSPYDEHSVLNPYDNNKVFQ